MKTRFSVIVLVFLRNRTAAEPFSGRLPGRITSSLNYNWASDKRSFNITPDFNIRGLQGCQAGILSES